MIGSLIWELLSQHFHQEFVRDIAADLADGLFDKGQGRLRGTLGLEDTGLESRERKIQLLKQGLRRTESAPLPPAIGEIGASVNPGNIPGDHTPLHLKPGQQGVGLRLGDPQTFPHIRDRKTALLAKHVQNDLLVICRYVLGQGTPPIDQFAIYFYRGEGGFSAPQKLSISDVSGLDTVNLPVPWPQIIACEPTIPRGVFLNGIPGDGIGEKWDHAIVMDQVRHRCGVPDDGMFSKGVARFHTLGPSKVRP